MNSMNSANDCLSDYNTEESIGLHSCSQKEAVPSIVWIRFPSCDYELDYYNDKFDLNPGDLVFVDGKMEGQRGCVMSVSRHFKVQAKAFRRVISRADLHVSGQFVNADSYLLCFDPQTLPYSQFRSWVLPPKTEETEYLIGFEKEHIDLNDMNTWDFLPVTINRGAIYYQENRVLYLCLDAGAGRAIVDGTHPYEVEFHYEDGIITDLFCDCPYYYHCKHEIATMLQLKEILANIEERYAQQWKESGYFSAIFSPLFFSLSIYGNCDAVLTLA